MGGYESISGLMNYLFSVAKDIVQYGLLRPESEQGYSVEELELYSGDKEDPRKGTIIEKSGQRYILNPDPTGRRTGEGT